VRHPKLPKIDRVLSADGELQPVLAKARDLRTLGGLVDGFFPPDLARQVRVANIREGELVMTAFSPAAAAKIRLLAPSLSRYLATQRWQVNSVSVRVQPTRLHSQVPQGKREKTVQLSTSGVASLQALHARMGDSPARKALGDLIAHHTGDLIAPPTAGDQQALREEKQQKPDQQDERDAE
jgi:hypothetical protein